MKLTWGFRAEQPRPARGAVAPVRVLALGLLLGLLSPASARADCFAENPPVPWTSAGPTVSANQAALAARYAQLAHQDPDGPPGPLAKSWRDFLVAADADPATPPAMIVRANIWLTYALGETDPVEFTRTLARAEAVAKTAPDPAFAPIRLAVRSMIATTRGDFAPAEADAKLAEAAAHQLTDARSTQLFWALKARYFAVVMDGRDSEAIPIARDALDVARACLPPDHSNIAVAASNLAFALDSAGRLDEALVVDEGAAAWAMAHLPRGNEALNNALQNYANSLQRIGRQSEAEPLLARVLDDRATYNAQAWTKRAITLANYANAIDGQGRHADATALRLQAFAWYQKQPMTDFTAPAHLLETVATTAENQGDLAGGIARRRQAIAYLTQHNSIHGTSFAQAQLGLADALAAAGHLAEARKLARAAMPMIARLLPPGSIWRLQAEIRNARITAADIATGTGGARTALALARAAAEPEAAKILDPAAARRDIVRYPAIAVDAFQTAAELALRAGDGEAAFHWLQLANTSQLVLADAMATARRAAQDPGLAALVRAYQDAIASHAALDHQKNALAAAGNAAETALLTTQIAEARALIATRQQALQQQFPEYLGQASPAPISLAQYRQGLRNDQLLLVPLVSHRHLLIVMVTSGGLSWADSGASGSEAVRLAARTRASIDGFIQTGGGAFDTAASARLYALLVPAKLRPLLVRHPALLYLAGGALAQIPPAILVAPGGSASQPNWLVRSHNITIVSRLAAAAAVPEKPRASGGFLGVGAVNVAAADDGADAGIQLRGGRIIIGSAQHFAALPGALRELQAMAGLRGGNVTLLTGDSATKARLRGLALNHYDLIAFATHTVAARDSGSLSEPALLLSRGPGAAPGAEYLTASDIAHLDLDADWVVLSACSSGDGAQQGAPAYSGLASAFIEAGARALLVTHWPVRDDAAAALTLATVKAAQAGTPRAVALQRAMLSLMANRRVPQASHPAIWAPFVLIGK